MGTAKTLLSAEEFDNYPFEEDKRYELDEGELIVTDRPAYWHNHVLGRLTVDLAVFLREGRIGEALISENVYALSPTTRRSPDLAVILGNLREELRNATVIHIIPHIVAEVLEPGETPRQIDHKLKQYFDAGVKEIWLIDSQTNQVEVWTGPMLPAKALTASDTLTSRLLPGFALPLAELFSESF
jgi:Uma2 family endonuclease